MTTENLSKEVENRLTEFFSNTIDPKDMAKTIRQVNYTLSLCTMSGCETIQPELNHLESNFYWLHRLSEVLDPYLDVE